MTIRPIRPAWKPVSSIALAAVALALAAGSIPPAMAVLLVTEPFNYTARVYPAGNWAGLSGSGTGWGSNLYQYRWCRPPGARPRAGPFLPCATQGVLAESYDLNALCPSALWQPSQINL